MSDKLGANPLKTGDDIVEVAANLVQRLGPYKPEVKSMTVDYMNKSSILKVLLTVPEGMKRMIRDVEIPAYSGYSIYEVYEGDSLNKVNLDWVFKDGKWVTDASKLPSSEKYFVILRGSVTEEALNQIVGVFCPEDPKKETDADRYWIQSGIKDMSILEKIYSELSVERVAVDVKVGLERSFVTSIPRQIREMLEARARADEAMDSLDRQRVFREWLNYRRARRDAGRFSVETIVDLGKKILAPETFLVFLRVDEPYKLGEISRVMQSGLVPDAIRVNVQTDLNFKRPAAQGNLTFLKKNFSDTLSKEFRSVDK